MTLYATGARRAEAADLKVGDIDSQRMVVHIREGNGGKDRDVMLSPKLLEELRTYWRGLRRKPKEWLFPGNRWHTASYPVTTKVLWTACQLAAERAGLEHMHIHPHTLRHYSVCPTITGLRRKQWRPGASLRIKTGAGAIDHAK
jgi:integrase